MRYSKKWFICIIFFIIAVSLISVILDTKEMFSTFNKVDIDCFVITMQTPERMKNIKENQSKVKFNIKIFDAVDGAKIDVNSITDPIIEDSFKNDTSKIRKREIGCYLSHYNLYKKIESESDANGYTIIFEDDFLIMSDDFEDKITKTLKDMESSDFDILYIYNTSDNIGTKYIENVCEIDKSKYLWGTMAYIVKNKNINRIINKTLYMNVQIDKKFWQSFQNGELKIYTFCPFLAKTSGMPSTIQVE